VSARNLLLFSLLLAAAIGSWYLARIRADQDSGTRSVDPVHRGFYLKSARILGTGPDGSLLYEIRAQHAEEQLDGSIEFTEVRLDYSPETEVPWTVKADSATILPIEQRVQLRRSGPNTWNSIRNVMSRKQTNVCKSASEHAA
jgi:LPS export ABC transporter protein LptC